MSRRRCALALALGLLLPAAAAAHPTAGPAGALVVLATVAVGRHPVAMALDSAAGRLFVLDGGNYNPKAAPLQGSRVEVLSTASGKLLLTIPLSPTIYSSGGRPGYLALDRPHHRLYVIEDGAYPAAPRDAPVDVRVLDSRTGATLGRASQQALALAVDGASGRAYSIAMLPPSAPGFSYALLDATSGTVLASFGGRSPVGLGVAPTVGRVDVALTGSSPCPSKNPVCPNGALVSFDARGATLRASSPPILSPYAVGIAGPPDRAFVGFLLPGIGSHDVRERLNVLDAATGAQLSTIDDVGITQYGVASDARRGEAYVLGERRGVRGLQVVDLRTGRLLRTLPTVLGSLPPYQLPGPGVRYRGVAEAALLAADPSRNQLLGVAAAFGPALANAPIPSTAYVEDERTGALLGQAPVGRDPSALALDPATGHAFVANALDGTITVLGLAPVP